MKNTFAAAIGAGLLFSLPAAAVEVTGGSVGLSYSTFTDDTDVNRIGINGSIELGWNQNWSSQIDLGQYRFGTSNADTTAFGLHTIYHLNDATSFGLFYTVEKGDGDTVDILGLEAGHEFGTWDVEGFVAKADSTGSGSANMFGVMGRTEFANGFGFGAAYQSVDVGTFDIQRLSVALDRDVSANTNVFVEIGSARVSVGGASASEPFIGIGGTYRFGAERGATFQARNVSGIIPGS